ncbi:BRCA1-associated protein [Melia azedarach]|uniref:BRCA1-associated protein n=1 Tax=Melia azedarach TaxID=155640 RepID=A0ACC1XBZ9_MELAZ|nr:BRCA1-associated protein [Melia azedarach]
MFVLRVHSVDANHPIIFEESGFSTVTTRSSPNPSINPNPKFSERRGLVHLFRGTSQSYLQNPSSPSTCLFVVAVPNYLSSDEFIRFCGSHIDHVDELIFIRNDGMEDRYSVLIKLVDQLTADEFYSNFNGKRFSPAEAEVCHMLYMLSVEYTELAEIASAPPAGFTELPTCPICLERLDPDTSGILSTICDHSFQCSCTAKWTYLSCQVCRFCQQDGEKPTCSVCGTVENLWVCLICGFVGCGRYKEGHAVRHWKDTQHCYSLDLRTQQIWDYVGDNYVHRLNQSKVDGKLVEMNSPCMSHEAHCGTCEFSEDSGISGALFNSKVEAIVDEYNRLLATQLETQRQYYESLLTEAKSKRESSISDAVEKAVASKMHDIQNELEKCEEAKKAVGEVNKNLMKNQEIWRRRVKEIEEREASSVRLKDEIILDLEEQIRDLTVYIEAQKTLTNITDSDGIRGGTVLPVSYEHSSPANARRHKKLSRRRN